MSGLDFLSDSCNNKNGQIDIQEAKIEYTNENESINIFKRANLNQQKKFLKPRNLLYVITNSIFKCSNLTLLTYRAQNKTSNLKNKKQKINISKKLFK